MAIIYDDWLIVYGRVPPQWIKVVEWKILNNVVCGADTVSFYAVDPGEAENLIRNLQEFSKELQPMLLTIHKT